MVLRSDAALPVYRIKVRWLEWKLSFYQAGWAGSLGDAAGPVYSGRLPKRI